MKANKKMKKDLKFRYIKTKIYRSWNIVVKDYAFFQVCNKLKKINFKFLKFDYES